MKTCALRFAEPLEGRWRFWTEGVAALSTILVWHTPSPWTPGVLRGVRTPEVLQLPGESGRNVDHGTRNV